MQQVGSDANGQPVVYVERRGPRSVWGNVWKWLLILWTGFFAYDAARISLIANDLSRKAEGLGKLAISNVATNKLLETMVVWLFGALVLGALAYMTRGPKVIEAVPVSVRGSGAKS